MLDEILLQLSVSTQAGRDGMGGTLRLRPGTRRQAAKGIGWAPGCMVGADPEAPPPCALQASVPVDVMPGEFDPTNYTLPQQPLHPCMFPLATAYSTLQLVTNPYQATIDGVR